MQIHLTETTFTVRRRNRQLLTVTLVFCWMCHAAYTLQMSTEVKSGTDYTFGKGCRDGSLPVGLNGRALAVGYVRDKVPQKPFIFCKLYSSGLFRNKSKQHFVNLAYGHHVYSDELLSICNWMSRCLRGLCKFVEEKLPVNHATNLTWDDVIRAQVSLGMLPVSSHPDHQYQQPQSMTGKAETYQYQVMPGGRSIPAWCIPRHRVAVIVSFRARDQHLTSFIGHLHPFLRSQLLDFIIIVVQQVC